MIRATVRLPRPAGHLGRALALTLVLGLVLVLGLGACGKADEKKCELSCRNYATITFREIEAKSLPPEQHEAALAKKLADGTTFCVSKCQSANNDEQSECRIAAKTLSQLKACD
jgi:hypothetical protein